MTNLHTVSLPDEDVLAGLLYRMQNTENFEQFRGQGERCGWCFHPIRLAGMSTTVDLSSGEITSSYSSDTEPSGVLLKACGTRRATLCPSCASVYAADARMLIRSGLSGGKGIPNAVANHPMVFATFTAPSFGKVHRANNGSGGCQRVKKQKHCSHGQALGCNKAHSDDDPIVGEPLCMKCYDYRRAVLWNSLCSELWRRTTIYTKRELAQLLGMSQSAFSKRFRLSFAKVAEYQRRGVVHLHAVIRIDSATKNLERLPRAVDISMLISAITSAVAKVSVPYPSGISGFVRWGPQLDVRVISNEQEYISEIASRDTHNTSEPTSGMRSRTIANYIAKYVTKSTDDNGALDRRLHSLSDLDQRGVTGHLRRMVETAWDLGGRPELASRRLRAWAHTLGFRGHCITKSRHYSVTFGYLRAERQAWQIRRSSIPDVKHQNRQIISNWKWVGTGWWNSGDLWLTELGAQHKAESRILAREAQCIDLMGLGDAKISDSIAEPSSEEPPL